MLTVPNLISFLRFSLALVFLKQNVTYRTIALIMAMISDGLDGYIARRYKLSSTFGTMLDPLADRFFIYFTMIIMIFESRLAMWEAGTLICRDIAVLLFGFYLVFTGTLTTFRFRAIWCGKATTFIQFLVLFGLIFGVQFPAYLYGIFVLLGVLALAELYFSSEAIVSGQSPRKLGD